MSVSILLVPLAISAVSALHARAAADDGSGVVYQVGTRMKDVDLVLKALEGAGATAVRTDRGLDAEWAGITANFHRGTDEIWAADFTGDVDEARALELVQAVDEGYGLLVQATVLARISERAAEAGLSLTSKTQNDDASVTMLLKVDRINA